MNYYIVYRSRDCSVGVVTRLRLERRGMRIRCLEGTKDLSLRPDALEPTQPRIERIAMLKRLGHYVGHAILFSTRVILDLLLQIPYAYSWRSA